ncbi:hypothetical protein [Streptomyces sp. NPDC006552]|uniref:hypothetical protein n=1 Tax=Streptomyces sp. NPDC006552 TaxID=3157179 RepID=UPI0033A6E5A3
MSRSALTPCRRTAGVVSAALLSLGLLTACGSGSPDTAASRPPASASRTAGAPTGSPDAGAKGSAKLSEAEGGELNLQGGDTLVPRQFRLSLDGGTETLTEVSGLTVDQPTQQFPSDGYRLVPGEQQHAGTVTVVRGAERSQQFTDLIEGRTRPATASIDQLDFEGAMTKRMTLQEPTVSKVENGDAQSVTLHFTGLTIS